MTFDNFKSVNTFYPYYAKNYNRPLKGQNSINCFLGATSNNSKNIFLKEYIEKNLDGLPNEIKINIYSPEKISPEDVKLLRDVRVKTYKARVDDMFNLLENSNEYVANRIKDMNITQEEKDNLIKLKEKYNNYYNIEIETPNKKYNLLNLSENDIKELESISPELVKFARNENKNLTSIKNHFATAEIKKEVLADSGQSSRYGAYALVPVLLVLGAKAIWEQKSTAKEIAKNPEKYLQEQKEILKEGNPLKTYLSKGGWGKYLKDLKGGNVGKWFSILALAFAGSWDDDLGAVKDYFQDRDNFGNKKAIIIAIPSMIIGTLTSFVIAPIMDNMISFNRAKAYVKKHTPEAINHIDKRAKAAFIIGNTLLGITFSAFCSGSSWTSEILTYLQLRKNKQKLIDKNILNNEETQKTSTYKNFVSYEAYSGKLKGILEADPLSGALFGGAGWLTSANPYVNAAATTVCGCIETITASIKQFTKDSERKHDIEKEKEKLIASL